MRLLACCASPRERQGLMLEPPPLVLGVGKAMAAVTASRALAQQRPDAVVLFGVCGAYPRRHQLGDGVALAVGELCLVGTEMLGDEGVAVDQGFLSIESLELGLDGPFAADVELTARICARLGVPVVRGATVSTCSGTDARSRELAARTRAHVETMEGAAVALACRAAGVPWISLRCVSNLTGERERAGWDLEGAVARVQAALSTVVEAWP